MERLTQRIKTGEVLMASEHEEKYTTEEWICVLQDRLAAYEDTGLTPEGVEYALRYLNSTSTAEIKGFEGVSVDRLLELAAADKEGHVIVLPCKMGDTVYFVNAKQILEFTVVGYAVDETGISWVYSEHVDKTGHTNERTFSPDRFGKNTFLTREEAERAMEGTP